MDCRYIPAIPVFPCSSQPKAQFALISHTKQHNCFALCFSQKTQDSYSGYAFLQVICGATVPSQTDSEFPIGIFDIVNIPDQLNKNEQIDDADLELQIYIF